MSRLVVALFLCLFSFISLANETILSESTDRLAQLEEILVIESSPGLPFLKKHRGIIALYDLVFDLDNNSYFGQESIIRRVIIIEGLPGRDLPEGFTVNMQEHTLEYPFNGSIDQNITEALPRFKSELKQIEDLITNITEIAPNIVFKREKDLLLEETLTNADYLNILHTLDEVLTNPIYAAALSLYDQVIFTQSAYRTTGIHTYSQTNLEIISGNKEYEFHDCTFDDSTLEKMVDIVAVQGFYGIDHFFYDTDYKSVINELWEFLTPLQASFLQQNGVESFKLDQFYQSKPELFNNGELILGLTRSEMEEIVNIIF